MYHVKGQGKNGYQFYSNEMNVPYIEKLSLDTRIHKALDNNEFNLVYQPQINLKTVLLEDEVDLEQLAQKMRGYSGADVTNVCRDAAMMPMRRRIKGLKREEIKNLNEKVEDLPVSQADLFEA